MDSTEFAVIPGGALFSGIISLRKPWTLDARKTSQNSTGLQSHQQP
jgi:hypothetical protein